VGAPDEVAATTGTVSEAAAGGARTGGGADSPGGTGVAAVPGTAGGAESAGTAAGAASAVRSAVSTAPAGASAAGGHASPPGVRGSPRRTWRPYVATPAYAFRACRAAISCGTTVKTSPTTPKSAMSKMGASPSLFTATIVLAVCIPALCWMAPEMPRAM